MYYNPFKGFWEPFLEHNELILDYIHGKESNP